MKEGRGISAAIFTVLVVGMIVSTYLQDKALREKLDECSVYTVATTIRVFRLRGMPNVEYSFTINNDTIREIESVNHFDTNEPWSVNMNKLRKKRLLLVQAYCKDKGTYQVLWDIHVPDTLQHIPKEGWEKIPFKYNIISTVTN